MMMIFVKVIIKRYIFIQSTGDEEIHMLLRNN